ncbi:Pirin-related protein [Synechococcus sp. PCC 7502]|uniref:pirin family protein n=1 Tax=Synechococcus sp. PCC 7502 TaxID=1173263 RepID=UPI00029FFB3E|nr:pirin family protein [Synechococcus sp. PCC 7502]AFY73997.1 Pirin-related protein [Synechococcus sp. PCC 7502]
MLTLRKSEERGFANHGWLKSYHTFSFANYYDPAHIAFRSLRVINEDFIQQGMGFGTHSHKDMEIITYVLEGALEHKDSMGNSSVIYPGEVQRLSAGKGITHSEYNHSQTELAHILQIWILPDRNGIEPSYEQKTFTTEEKQDQLRLVVSKDGRDNSVTAQQDLNIYATVLSPNSKIAYTVPENRYGWLHIARGKVSINDLLLSAGDAVAVETPQTLNIVAEAEAEVLIFDLA